MTFPPDGGDPEVEARYRDLLYLHAQAPEFQDLDLSVLPGYDEFSVDAAMRVVAAAPADEVPVAARLAVLYDLARAGVPSRPSFGDAYHVLAGSALELTPGPPPLVPTRLVDDMIASAAAGLPFAETESAGAFAHHQTAFIGQNVCTVRRVRVGGIRATWIYSEFETDAPFEGVAHWIDARNWHDLAPTFFRRMDLLGAPPAPVTLAPPPAGDEHWQGIFHEEVRLLLPVITLLRCSRWRAAGAAATTYDLDLSLDQQIDVDRGFLLVTDTGPVRRVQVLKIVSFTNDAWDALAPLVCPFWTDWIRAAVEGGTASAPKDPTQAPEADSPCAETVDAWVRFFGTSAGPYVDLGTDVTSRLRSREYGTPDLIADGTRLFSQLAKDWARAWTSFTDTVEEISREGLDAGITPPGVAREVGRHTLTAMTAAPSGEAPSTVVPLAGLAATDRPVCSDLVSIDAATARLPATDITVTVEPVYGGGLGARVVTTNTSAPPGLYVGSLDTPDGRLVAPVHLYVSRATGV